MAAFLLCLDGRKETHQAISFLFSIFRPGCDRLHLLVAGDDEVSCESILKSAIVQCTGSIVAEPAPRRITGDPRDGIVQAALDTHVDYIVLGAPPWGIGARVGEKASLSAFVAEYAPCSVIIVKGVGAPRSAKDGHKWWVCTDGSKVSAEVFSAARQLATPKDKAVLASVLTPTRVWDELYDSVDLYKEAVRNATQRDAEQRSLLEAALDDAAALLQSSEITVSDTMVRTGEPSSLLVDLTRGADVVAIGARGASSAPSQEAVRPRSTPAKTAAPRAPAPMPVEVEQMEPLDVSRFAADDALLPTIDTVAVAGMTLDEIFADDITVPASPASRPRPPTPGPRGASTFLTEADVGETTIAPPDFSAGLRSSARLGTVALACVEDAQCNALVIVRSGGQRR